MGSGEELRGGGGWIEEKKFFKEKNKERTRGLLSQTLQWNLLR